MLTKLSTFIFFSEKPVNMSSQSDLITSLQLSLKYLYQIGGPIQIFIGTVSCILNIIIFGRKNLRKNPCSIYLLAFNVSNFLAIYITILSLTLATGYNIAPTSYILGYCRFSLYMTFVLEMVSPFYLILASVDRVLVTSTNAGTRRRSTRRLAYICISGVTLFWVLFHIYTLVSLGILQFAPNYFVCYAASVTGLAFITYYSFIIKSILAPLIMAIFAVWTMKNIRSIHHARVVPVALLTSTAVEGGLNSTRAKDRQLMLILMSDILIYIISVSMLSAVTMYQQFTEYNGKSNEQTQIDLFLVNVAVFINWIRFCVEFYANLVVSKTFRNEVKNTILCR